MATNVRGVWLLIRQEVIAMQKHGQGRNRQYFLNRTDRGKRSSVNLWGEQRVDAVIRHVALEGSLAREEEA
jgi:hypothetical protein